MFPNTIMEEIILSLLYTVGIVSWMSWLCMHGLTSVLSILFHWSTCLFLYQTVLTTMCAVLCLFAQSCPNLWDPMDCILWDSSIHRDFPDNSTGVGFHALPQGIVPTQGSNPGLPHCRRILYHLSPQGSPRILKWVACPFSRGSSWPRNQTWDPCITDGFFTSWATREALWSL